MKLKADIDFVNSDGYTFYYDGINASVDETEIEFTINSGVFEWNRTFNYVRLHKSVL